MDYNSLFRNLSTEEGANEYLLKVRIADGWGNQSFILRGEVPPWMKKIKVPVFSGKGQHTPTLMEAMTVDDLVEGCLSKTKYGKAKISAMTILMNDEKVVDIIKLTRKKESTYIRRCFHELFVETYKEVEYMIGDGKSTIIVTSNGEDKGIVMPLLIDDKYTINTPVEAVRKMVLRNKVR